jgi:hypothetical protein
MFVVLPIVMVIHEQRIRQEEPDAIPEESLTYVRPLHLAVALPRLQGDYEDEKHSTTDVETKLCA